MKIKETRHDIFIPAIKRMMVDGGIQLKDATSANWHDETEKGWLTFCTKFEWEHTKFPNLQKQHDASKIAIFQTYWDIIWESKSDEQHEKKDHIAHVRRKRAAIVPEIPSDAITLKELKKATKEYYNTPLKQEEDLAIAALRVKRRIKPGSKKAAQPIKVGKPAESEASSMNEHDRSLAPSVMDKLKRSKFKVR